MVLAGFAMWIELDNYLHMETQYGGCNQHIIFHIINNVGISWGLNEDIDGNVANQLSWPPNIGGIPPKLRRCSWSGWGFPTTRFWGHPLAARCCFKREF